MPYKIYFTKEFEKAFNKLNKGLKRQVKNKIEQLKVNPYASKPLGRKYLREKKVKNHRIYFLIYDDSLVVVVVNISTKKDQQKTIDKIKSSLHSYKEFVKKMLRF